MQIIGIVNVTPDSFSDGGAHEDHRAAIDHALRLEDAGADILDIGGESTRPGAETISADRELRRVMPVIEAVAARSDARLSIDTRKPRVAEAAVAAGAAIWNDVTALRFSPDSLSTAVRLGCEVILMHMQGDPQTMQLAPAYSDVVSEVKHFLDGRIRACEAAGIARDRIIVDPGIGFGKAVRHNVALLKDLEAFTTLGVRCLLGASRKRFIAELDRDGPAGERIGGSIASALRAASAGFGFVRVHDVEATRQALAVAAAIAPDAGGG